MDYQHFISLCGLELLPSSLYLQLRCSNIINTFYSRRQNVPKGFMFPINKITFAGATPQQALEELSKD